MKKFAMLAGSAALLLTMVTGVMASRRHGDEVSIRNYARVTNDVETKADSGDNEISGRVVRRGRIETGNASATSDVFSDVNTTSLGCGCADDLTIRNNARVRNDVDTRADSGDNEIHGHYVGGGVIDTGRAHAEGLVTNYVNSTLVGGESSDPE